MSKFFRILSRAVVLLSLVGLSASVPVAIARDGAPTIRHEPLKVAAQGQPLSIRVSVKDATGAVKSVSLFYTTSRDAAPFRLPMQDSGAGIYVGTIPGNMLGGAATVSYYIEAVDSNELTTETSWYTVKLTSPAEAGTAAGEESEGWSWQKKTLVGVGAVALVGGGVALAASGGDSGGGGSGDADATLAGSYVGSATTFLQFGSEAQQRETHGIQITVAEDGALTTSTLLEGVPLSGQVSGNSFSLTTPVSGTNYTGEVRYEGSVVDGRITGVVDGAVTRTDGTRGEYAGFFSATRPTAP